MSAPSSRKMQELRGKIMQMARIHGRLEGLGALARLLAYVHAKENVIRPRAGRASTYAFAAARILAAWTSS